MSTKYSLTFLSLSASCLAAGITLRADLGWTRLAFLHSGMSFALLSWAYARAGPSLLLKRSSGRMAAPAWILFGPYLLLNSLVFAVYRRFSSEPPFARVSRDLYFGRRLSAGEAKRLDCVHILDLACEFTEVEPLRRRPGYRSLPLLDAAAPTHEQLAEATTWIDHALRSGPVYIHCALGHGRSGTVVIAYFLAAGHVRMIGEGVQLLTSLRRGAEPNSAQLRSLREFQASKS